MNYIAIIVVALFLGGHVYSYMQIQRLYEALESATAETTTLSQKLDAANMRLNERIEVNATDVDALRASNEESATVIVQRLDGLEAGIREDVSRNLTDEIVQAATSDAIERVVLENLPQSDLLLTALGGVLTEKFRKELQGVPGEQVDPAILASLLARNEDFLDALKFDLLAVVEAGE